MQFDLKFEPVDEGAARRFRNWKAGLGSSPEDQAHWADFYLTHLAVRVAKLMNRKSRMVFGPLEVTGNQFFTGTATLSGGFLKITILDLESGK